MATASVAAAYVNNDGGATVTSGSFDVVTDDLIVVVGNADTAGDTTDITWAISDNQVPDLTYTLIAERDGTDGIESGVIAWYHKVAGNITGLTITIAVVGFTDSPAIKVYKITGYDTTDIVGAQTEGDWTSSGQQTGNITAETAGIGILVATDWNQNGTPTSADTTETGFDTAGDISGMSGYRTLVAAASENADMTPATGTPNGNYLWFEIRTAAGGATAWGPLIGLKNNRLVQEAH